MFGLDFDKLLLVSILVGVIVGPARLREWRRAVPPGGDEDDSGH